MKICLIFAILLANVAYAGGPGKPPPSGQPVITDGETGVITFNGGTPTYPGVGCNPLGGAYPVLVTIDGTTYAGTQIQYELSGDSDISSTDITLPDGVTFTFPLSVSVTWVNSSGNPVNMTGTITCDDEGIFTITWDPV